jgi:hypothetical protein
MTIGEGIQVILGALLKQLSVVLVHTKFHDDWFNHFSNIMGNIWTM